jgi:inhibitor of cysteine peptidase
MQRDKRVHHQLTSEHNGNRLAVSVGDTITVSLPETATTGYRWEPDVHDDVLRVADAQPVASATPRGAPGQRVITFEVLRPGSTQLRLVRKRSWEKTIQEHYAVELEAQDAART